MSEETKGHESPEDSQGTDDSLNIVQSEAFNQHLNRVITSRMKDQSTRQDKALAAFKDELIGVFKQTAPTGAPEMAESTDAPKDESPRMNALQRELEELRKRVQHTADERDAEKAKSRHNEMLQKLSSALGEGGIDTVRMRHAIGFLVNTDKRVTMDEDGNVLFCGDSDDELPLSDGVKLWLKSEDAKPYLPPLGVQGSGSSVPNSGRSAPKNPRETALAALRSTYNVS